MASQTQPKLNADTGSGTLRTDFCIVGAGRAGFAMAAGAAAVGVPAIVVDRDDLASALPRAGDIARLVLRDAAASGKACDWQALKARAIAAAESAAPGMSAARLQALGVTVLRGSARFTGPGRLEASGVAIEARRIVLATGVAPSVPLLPGLDEVSWLGADRWLDLDAVPPAPIILGAGRTGIELAQWFSRLGSRATVVDGAAPLREFDDEMAAPVLARLFREGISLHAHRQVIRAEKRGDGVALVMARPDGTEEVVVGSHLMLATGRRPAVDGLRLDLGRIRGNPQGIAVDTDGRTSHPSVYAVGDVTGRGRSAEAAEAQAGIALRSALLRQRKAFKPRSVPRCLLTDPALAVVGLTESEARARFGRIGVWRWPLAETDLARARGMTTGHIRVLTTASQRIVGAAIVGPDAVEMIGFWTLAVAQEMKLQDIATLSLPASSSGEASRRVALQGTLSRLGSPWVQKALRMVRWMG